IAFEMDGTFLLGRLFSTILTFFLLKLFFFPWLMNYLRYSPKDQHVSRDPILQNAVSTEI
ncbi:MAG: hypothetical protein ABIT07_00835, partial [Ferruginibacter sp.]